MPYSLKIALVKVVAIVVLLILLAEPILLVHNGGLVVAQENYVSKGWPQYLKNPQHTSLTNATGPRTRAEISIEHPIAGEYVSTESLYNASFSEAMGMSAGSIYYTYLRFPETYPVVDANGTLYAISYGELSEPNPYYTIETRLVKLDVGSGDYSIINLGYMLYALPPMLSPDQKEVYVVGLNYSDEGTIYEILLYSIDENNMVRKNVLKTINVPDIYVKIFLSKASVGANGIVYISATMFSEGGFSPTSRSHKIGIYGRARDRGELSIHAASAAPEGLSKLLFYAANPSSGALLWSLSFNISSVTYDVREDQEMIYAPAQLSDGKVVLAFMNELAVVDNDGNVVSHSNLSGNRGYSKYFCSDPMVDDNDNIYILKCIEEPNTGNYNVSIVKYSSDLTIMWEKVLAINAHRYEYPKVYIHTPSYDGDYIYVPGSNKTGDIESKGFIYVFNASNGQLKGKLTEPDAEFRTPIVLDGSFKMYLASVHYDRDEYSISIKIYCYDRKSFGKNFEVNLEKYFIGSEYAEDYLTAFEIHEEYRPLLVMDSSGNIAVQYPDDLVVLKKTKPYTPPPLPRGVGGGVAPTAGPRYENYLLELPLIKVTYEKPGVVLVGSKFTYEVHVENLGNTYTEVILSVYWPNDHYDYVSSVFSKNLGRLLVADLKRRILVFDISLYPKRVAMLNSETIKISFKLKSNIYKLPGEEGSQGKLVLGEEPASPIIANPLAILPTARYLDVKAKVRNEGYDLNTPNGIAVLIRELVKETAVYNNEVFEKFLKLPKDVQIEYLKSMEGTEYQKIAEAFMITVVKEDLGKVIEEYFKKQANTSPPIHVSHETQVLSETPERKGHGSLIALGKALTEPKAPIIIGNFGNIKKPMELIMYGGYEAPEGDFWAATAREIANDAELKKNTKSFLSSLAMNFWESFATGEVADTMFGELAGAVNFVSFGLVDINYAPFGNYECFYVGKKIGAATAAIESVLALAAWRFGGGAAIKLVTKGVGKEPIHWGIDIVTKGSRFYADGTVLNVIHIGKHVEFGWHLGLFSFGNYKTYLHLYANRIVLPMLLSSGSVAFQEIPYSQLPYFLFNRGIYYLVSDPNIPQRLVLRVMGEIAKRELRPLIVIDGREIRGPVGVAPIDPNDIMAYPGKYVFPGSQVDFIVHFENLANATAPAHNITVTAYLDRGFNMSSLKLNDASHPDKLKYVRVDNESNTITWYFENITLPPNKNPPEGEGYVSFSIKVNDTLPLGYMLNSSAEIVFDYNPPLKTRIISHLVDYAAPNPADVVNVELNGTLMKLTFNSNAPDPGGSGVKEAYIRVDGGIGNRASVKLNTTVSEALVKLSPNIETYFLTLDVKDNAGNVAHEIFKIVNEKAKVKVQVGNVEVVREEAVGKRLEQYNAGKCGEIFSKFTDITLEYSRLRNMGEIALDIPMIPKGTMAYKELSEMFGENFEKYPTYPGRIQLLYATLYRELRSCLGEE